MTKHERRTKRIDSGHQFRAKKEHSSIRRSCNVVYRDNRDNCAKSCRSNHTFSRALTQYTQRSKTILPRTINPALKSRKSPNKRKFIETPSELLISLILLLVLSSISQSTVRTFATVETSYNYVPFRAKTFWSGLFCSHWYDTAGRRRNPSRTSRTNMQWSPRSSQTQLQRR